MRNAQAMTVIHHGHFSEFPSPDFRIKDLRHGFAVYLLFTVKKITQKS